MSVVVRQVRESEREAWRGLYDGYADFYEKRLDDAHLDRLWQRITAERTVECTRWVTYDLAPA